MMYKSINTPNDLVFFYLELPIARMKLYGLVKEKNLILKSFLRQAFSKRRLKEIDKELHYLVDVISFDKPSSEVFRKEFLDTLA